MSPSDAALLDRWIARRDADAFEVLVDRYAGLVYGASYRVLRDAGRAEDVAQESFMRLADALNDAPASLAAWLHTVATRRALNRLRSEKRLASREQRYAAEQAPALETQWDDIKVWVDEDR